MPMFAFISMYDHISQRMTIFDNELQQITMNHNV